MNLTTILQIVLAIGLLFLGRRLYWGFVGAIGFITVTEWALAYFQGQPEWVALLLGLAAGVIGALLAIFIRVVGIGLAGFLGGAYLMMNLGALFNLSGANAELILAIIGGILGLILILAIFDWALIFISAFSGATLLAKYIPLDVAYTWVVILFLAVVGIIVQVREKNG